MNIFTQLFRMSPCKVPSNFGKGVSHVQLCIVLLLLDCYQWILYQKQMCTNNWVLWRILRLLGLFAGQHSSDWAVSLPNYIYSASNQSYQCNGKKSTKKQNSLFQTMNQEWDFLWKIPLTLRRGSERLFATLLIRAMVGFQGFGDVQGLPGHRCRGGICAIFSPTAHR